MSADVGLVSVDAGAASLNTEEVLGAMMIRSTSFQMRNAGLYYRRQNKK